MSARTAAVLPLALALGLTLSAPAGAQQTFRACYVPVVGAMYFLDLPGLPTECVSQEHEVIEWTEGGSASGPVGTDDIEDGAVTSAKIADGQVLEADIGHETINSAHIQFGAVQSADIGNGAVQSQNIAPGAVDGSRLGIGLVRLTDQLTVPSGDGREVSLYCPDGLEVVSGGWYSNLLYDFFTSASAPMRPFAAPPGDTPAIRWYFRFRNRSTADAEVYVYALCADLEG